LLSLGDEINGKTMSCEPPRQFLDVGLGRPIENTELLRRQPFVVVFFGTSPLPYGLADD